MEDVYILPEANWNAALFVILALSILTTALRLYVRIRVLRSWSLDDVLISLAMAAGIAHSTLQYYKNWTTYKVLDLAIANGGELDRKSSAVLLNRGIRFALVALIVYLIELALIKCSILAFYLRLSSKWSHSYTIYTIACCVIINSVIHISFKFYQWDPFRAVWMIYLERIPFVERADPEVLEIANTSFQCVVDIVLLAIPIVPLLRMHLPKSKRVALVIIYSFGFLSLGATLARLAQSITFQRIDDNPILSKIRNLQFTLWTQVELGTAIICANVPGLFALVRTWSPFNFSNASGSRPRRPEPPSFVCPRPKERFAHDPDPQTKMTREMPRKPSAGSTAGTSAIVPSTADQSDVEKGVMPVQSDQKQETH